MEHLNHSIKIVCILRRLFPDNVVYNIRTNLRLAIDLNGYTNEQLIDTIKDNITYMLTKKIHKYIQTKYGYNRRKICLLKKYQLIHVIQKFNIHIPIRRHPLDQNKIFVDKHIDNITWDTNNIKYTLKDDNTEYYLGNSKCILMNIPYSGEKRSILIDKITNKYVRFYLFTSRTDNKLSHYKIYKLEYISKSKYMFMRIVIESSYSKCYYILYSRYKNLNIQNVPSTILDKIPDTYNYRMLNNFHDRLDVIKNHFEKVKHLFHDKDNTNTIKNLINAIIHSLSGKSYIKDINQAYLNRIEHALNQYENYIMKQSS